MKLRRILPSLAAAGALASLSVDASAQTWTTWTSSSPTSFAGTLFGSAVNFTGANIGGNLSNSGTDYFAPSGAYTQNGLTSPDAGGNKGLIQFNNPTSGTFLFNAPVVDLFLALVSVGQHGVAVSYTFDRPFTVVSNNTVQCAYWGCGTYTIAGNTIIGQEFSGTIEFLGPVNSLTFSTTNPENWHGVTVGANALAPSVTATPEPATFALMATGLVGIAGAAGLRRRKRAAVDA